MQLSIQDIRELLAGDSDKDQTLNLCPGIKVLIRTVTFHYLGVVSRVANGAVTLEKASWLADSGRFSEALAKGTVSEVEMYPTDIPVHVSLASIVDWCLWKEDLPTQTK